MQKSQMMMLVVVMAICCFSCISSSAMMAGIGGSAGPIAQFLDSQNQENGIQSAGTIREAAKKLCQKCQAANWEGTTGVGADSPCADLKQDCIDQGLLGEEQVLPGGFQQL